MAKIEKIELGGEQLTTEAASVKESPELEATKGKMFIDVGEAITEVSDHLERAQSLAEETKAKNYRNAEYTKARMDYETDPDPTEEKHKAYVDRLNNIGSQAANMISLPGARNSFINETGFKGEVEKARLNKTFNKRSKDQHEADLKENIDTTGQKFATAGMDSMATSERKMYIHELNTQLAKEVHAGFIGKKEAATLRINTLKNWNERALAYEAEKDPDTYISEAGKGDKGYLKGMPEEMVGKYLEKARAEKIKIQKTSEANDRLNYNARMHDLTGRALKHNLTGEELEKIAGQGGFTKPDGKFDKEYYNTLKGLIHNPNLTSEKRSVGYKDIMKVLETYAARPEAMESTDPETGKKVTKPANLDEYVRNINLKIAQHTKDGTLSPEDADDLHTTGIIPYEQKGQATTLKSLDEITRIEEEQKQKQHDRFKMFNNVWNMFKAPFVGVASSISGKRDLITDTLNSPGPFETKLTPEEETKFQAWKKQNAPDDSGADYDLRGAYRAGLTKDADSGHWNDKFKKPSHPTFSDQSQYAKGDYAKYAGHWEGDKFVPPEQRWDDQDDPSVRLMRKFVKEAKKGEITPDQAPKVANDLMKKQRLEDKPEMATYSKKGKPHVDAFGNVSHYFPDGDVREEESGDVKEPEKDNEDTEVERDTAN